jgi:phosphoenolpyruvate carboxykinase (ATP)
VNAILNGSLEKAQFQRDPVFGIEVPQSCPEVPSDILTPSRAWIDQEAYKVEARKLAELFKENFKQFSDQPGAAMIGADLESKGA